jgi:phosphoglycolate phosphatase
MWKKILAHFELRKYFEGVFGAGMDGLRADKTELLEYAVAETAAIPANSIMVGDRKHDVVGALNNKMGFIGVLYGYGSTAELRSAGARKFANTPGELTDKLR